MKVSSINSQPGEYLLRDTYKDEAAFCRFIAAAAQRFGKVTEVSVKGVFSHIRYQFLCWSCCLIPEHTIYKTDFRVDPETCRISNYRQTPLKVSSRWCVYR